MNDSKTISHPLAMGETPDWASGWGQDEYGVFADFSVQTGPMYSDFISQRMRWIPPGRFMMGSPDDEQDRNKNETLHQVTVSSGFWLANTCCSQQLWTQILGDNPSEFKSPENPVENVSWEDTQLFFVALSQQIQAAPKLQLPTEAQWEYACRAGSETPFSFGDNITTDQVNYDGGHPYAQGSTGIYREKTVGVGSLPCNPWGLFEMHGNVWEWCSDWFGDYPTKPVVDPQGRENGAYRVIRGGSWISKARAARSAYRSSWPPTARLSHVGFRCMIQSKQRPNEESASASERRDELKRTGK